MLKDCSSDKLLTLELKTKIKDDLREQYATTHLTDEAIMILKKASFLDPHFKTKYLSNKNVFEVESELLLRMWFSVVKCRTSSGFLLWAYRSTTQKKILVAYLKDWKKIWMKTKKLLQFPLSRNFKRKCCDTRQFRSLTWKIHCLGGSFIHLATCTSFFFFNLQSICVFVQLVQVLSVSWVLLATLWLLLGLSWTR